MTRQYEKVVQLSKKISKKGKVKTSTKHLKKNLPQPQEDEDETYNLEEPQETEEMQEVQENKETQEIQEPPASPNNILLLSSTCYLVLLDEEDHLVVNANFNVKVLCGKASAFGCPLDVNSKLLEIKSKGKSLIPIKAVESGSVNQDLIPFIVTSLNSIKSSSVKPQTEQKIKEFLDQRWDSVVLAITTTQPLKIESIRVIREDTEDHSFNPILYPSGIETDIARHILQHLSLNDMKKKILVVGDKNSGKSLLSVFLLNSMLSYLQENLPKSAVFYLESDLGQNSFFFPGTVGLFNFTEHVMSNLLQPRIYNPVVYDYVGEFSPQQFTSNYLKAIENCMKFYDFSSINCPLIINTHGYVANIGENILYDMIRIVKPDLVVLLDKHSDKISAVDHGYLEYNPIAKIEEEIRKRSFYEHKSIVGLPNETYRGPALWKLELPKFKEAVAHKKEKKDSAMLAYLLNSKSIDSKKTMNIPRISEICLAQPIELSFDEHLFSVLGNSSTIFFFREHFVKFSMMFISSIVSLNYSPYINTKELAYTQPFDFQNGLKNSSSKGFGYIRDINPEKRTILIVTPLTSQELSIVNVIVKSSQVQFSNDIYLEDSPLNIENWLNIPNYQDASNTTKVDKPFINDILYGVGSESYRNLKSLRKVQ